MSQTFLITAPDGTKYHVTGPDNATEQDALAQVQAQHQTGAPASDVSAEAPPPEVPPNPSEGGGTLQFGPFDTGIKTPQGVDRFLSGAGKAFVDIGRGAGQYLGLESRGDVAASRALDAPLMKTGMGKLGNFAGNVAMAVPTVAIPGANTVTGAGVLGATMGALQPSTSTRETLTNIGVGGAVGAASQYAGQKISSAVSNRLANRQAAAATEQSLNSERDAVLQAAQDVGYVTPPTATRPNIGNTALESASGKAATRQTMNVANQRVTNDLVRQDLGLAANQPVTQDALRGVIRQQGRVYGAVENALGNFGSDQAYKAGVQGITKVSAGLESAYPGIGAQSGEKVQQLAKALDVPQHSGKSAVGLFKMLNERATTNFKAAHMSGNPELLDLARAQSAAADEVGDLIDRQLQSVGKGDLSAAWQNARVTIAKSYQALGALKGNDVSAVSLAAQLQKGKSMSGGMALAAQFANHFGDVAKLPKSGAGVSKLGATVFGAGGVGAFFNPALGTATMAAPIASYGLRKGLAQPAINALLATPSYAPNALGTLGYQGVNALARSAYPLSLGLVETAQ